MTYAGLHSSAALQDDESRPRLACIDGCIGLAARRGDECMSRPRLAASWCIDGVAAAAGLHPSAARHDDERVDGVPAGLHALQAALDSRRCIDLKSPALLRMLLLMLMYRSYTAFLPLLHSNLAQAFARQEMMASVPSMNSVYDVF